MVKYTFSHERMCIFTEQMIKLIVETDKASRNEVDKALKRREDLTAQLALAEKQIDLKYKNDADSKITKERIIAQKETDNFKERLRIIEKSKADKLRLRYEENHKSWEKEIFRNITEN